MGGILPINPSRKKTWLTWPCKDVAGLNGRIIYKWWMFNRTWVFLKAMNSEPFPRNPPELRNPVFGVLDRQIQAVGYAAMSRSSYTGPTFDRELMLSDV